MEFERAELIRRDSATLRRATRLDPIIIIVIVALGTLLSWLRLPGIARATLWSEDSRVFLTEALTKGARESIPAPYAGYLQGLPRIAALFVEKFVPLGDWARAMTLSSCLVVGVIAALIYVCSRDVIGSRWIRAALAAVTVLVPLAPHEVLGNMANVHWYCLWLTPWLLLYRPRSRWGAWLLAAVALITTATEIQMAIFTPLILWRLRDTRRMPVRAFFLLGMVFQGIATLNSPRSPAGISIGPASLVWGYLVNGVMTIFVPTAKQIGHLLISFGIVPGVLLLVPFLVAAVWVFVFGNSLQRLMVATLLIAPFVLYCLAVETTPKTIYDYAHHSSTVLADPWLSRYGVVPSLSLLAIVVIAVSVRRPVREFPDAASKGRATKVRARGVIAPVVVGVSLAVLLIQFVPIEPTLRADGPALAPQVTAAIEKCRTMAPEEHLYLNGAPEVTTKDPQGKVVSVPFWSIGLPCSDVLAKR